MSKERGMNPAAFGALMKGDIENYLVASTPGGIEAQEAAGQRDFCSNSTLPREMLHGTREQLEGMGIRFGEPVDDLFIAVELPPGWRKEATPHSMWSRLLDDKDRERAGIFYKAAFYDRKAHISLTRRYSVNGYVGLDKLGNLVDMSDPNPNSNPVSYRTTVTDCGKPIHVIGDRDQDDHDLGDLHRDTAEAWLDEQFPDWRNPTAYWD